MDKIKKLLDKKIYLSIISVMAGTFVMENSSMSKVIGVEYI